MAVSVHTIAFKGPAGLTFTLLLTACGFYTLGFSSSAWHRSGDLAGVRNQYGLWEACTCQHIDNQPSWFTATQAFMTIGLVGLMAAVVLSALYMCLHIVSKNITIVALVVTCFTSAVVMLVGVLLFGIQAEEGLDRGFAMAVLGLCFTAGAAVMGAVQMRQSAVLCLAP